MSDTIQTIILPIKLIYQSFQVLIEILIFQSIMNQRLSLEHEKFVDYDDQEAGC
ncbi:MAG: hypothetical protein KAH00_08440 [Cocleimonas sp.]|nr:hypothetical protein [Cocleimonas sp.]